MFKPVYLVGNGHHEFFPDYLVRRIQSGKFLSPHTSDLSPLSLPSQGERHLFFSSSSNHFPGNLGLSHPMKSSFISLYYCHSFCTNLALLPAFTPKLDLKGSVVLKSYKFGSKSFMLLDRCVSLKKSLAFLSLGFLYKMRTIRGLLFYFLICVCLCVCC